MNSAAANRLLPNWLRFARTAQSENSPQRSSSQGVEWWRGLLADPTFWVVTLIWGVCWSGWALYLRRFGHYLPWCDEYPAFIGMATRESSLTWDYLWTPANEHRAPLTRLWCVLLGRLFDWNFRHMLQLNLAVLALACLPLLLAVRAVRGRSTPYDAFLPLLILTSVHEETLTHYAYGYAMALAVWCLTASAVMVKWQLRSTFHLLFYILGALVVAWSGGPAGNFWALGLCLPLVLGWFQPTSRPWKGCALLGGGAVAASSAFLLYTVPPSAPAHLAFHSDSWKMTFKAAAKFSVGWMGAPILEVIYPWALIALLGPMLYLLVRFLMDLRHFGKAAMTRWLDLTALLLSALLITGALAYGRAKYPGTWDSRYAVLEIPIVVVLFLMLIRCHASKGLLTLLTVGMALCVGWNIPSVLDRGRAMGAERRQLHDGLLEGHQPLSILAERYGVVTGWGVPGGPQHLVGWWQQMRLAHTSIFAKNPDLARRCLLWKSTAGLLGDALHPVGDAAALGGQAVQAEEDGEAATAVYRVTVSDSGVYRLCCRWRTPAPGRIFAVSVDGGPAMMQYVPDGPNYVPCVLVPPLPLESGTHRLAITWPGAGSRLDLLELNPQ
jgi:hypothetical protein